MKISIKNKSLHILYFAGLLGAGLLGGCHGGSPETQLRGDGMETEECPPVPASHIEILALLKGEDTVRAHNRWEAHSDSMPGGCTALRLDRAACYAAQRELSDSNRMHLDAADAIGISPINGVDDAWTQGGGLRRVESTRDYYIAPLVHSVPYLVPRAERLLADIGRSFRDSLQRRGGGDYRIKVTSLTRTEALVRRLRRRNGNATDSSAHMRGTTFDISYSHFVVAPQGTEVSRTQEDLKNLLTLIVADLRRQGRCFAKFERHQACVHITCR